MNSKCPNCGSKKIVNGKYLSQTDPLGTKQVFRPKGLKLLTLSGSDIPVKNTFEACIDCGLLYQNISREKLLNVIIKKGNNKLKENLGIK